MKPERLFPLILVLVGAVFCFLAYSKKKTRVEVPEAFQGNRPVELFYKHQCYTCHSVSRLPNAKGVLGPGLDNVGSRALEYNPEESGKKYLRESLHEPSKVVREGFVNGMPSFKGKIEGQDLELLVEWLASLKTEQPQ